MAQLIRPLRLWPRLQSHCCSHATLNNLVSSLSPPILSASRRLSFATAALSPTGPRGPRLPYDYVPVELPEGHASDSDSDGKVSRNQKKREARRAVRWAMDLASFTNNQIKRILSVASTDPEVYEAIMLVKSFGADVREGKRRQFSYIGKLLRNAEPELMDALIEATKIGDYRRLRDLANSVTQVTVDDDVDEEEDEDSEYEEEEEEPLKYIEVATRWFDGLVSKDIKVTNEVYSVQSVEFDRQELRKLVRRVHSILEQQATSTEENKKELDVAKTGAEKSLNQFLLNLAKKMPTDEYDG